MKTQPSCSAAEKWMRANHGNALFAPFTGQDWPAFRTFIHALDLYCHSDESGREAAIACMRYAVAALQPKVRWIAREAIPAIMDWGDREKLWPRIAPLDSSIHEAARQKEDAEQFPQLSPDRYQAALSSLERFPCAACTDLLQVEGLTVDLETRCSVCRLTMDERLQFGTLMAAGPDMMEKVDNFLRAHTMDRSKQ